MRKITLLAIVAILALSCKEKRTDNFNPKSIIGKWYCLDNNYLYSEYYLNDSLFCMCKDGSGLGLVFEYHVNESSDILIFKDSTMIQDTIKIMSIKEVINDNQLIVYDANNNKCTLHRIYGGQDAFFHLSKNYTKEKGKEIYQNFMEGFYSRSINTKKKVDSID